MDRSAIFLAILMPLLGAGMIMIPILWVVARGTGWSRLNDHYGRGRADGQVFTRKTIVMRRGPYLGVVRFHVTPEALRLSLPWFARFFHRPVALPWSEIEPGAAETIQVRRARLDMQRLTCADVHLWIPAEVWKARPPGVHPD